MSVQGFEQPAPSSAGPDAPAPLWSRQDVLAGALFLAVGGVLVTMGLGYGLGTATRMGSGYFPVLVGGLLSLVGLLVFIGGLRQSPPVVIGPLRPFLTLLAVGAFATTIDRFGLIPASLLLVLISGFAGERPRIPELVVTAMILAAASTAIFVWGLGLPLRIIAL